MKSFVHFSAAQQALRVTTTMDQLVFACLSALSSFIRYCESGPLVFSHAQRAQAYRYGATFLRTYTLLIKSDIDSRSDPSYVPLWKARPKCHSLWHTIDHMRFSCLNTVVLWSCWMEEDFMGKIGKICRRTHATTSAQRTLQRYNISLHVELLSKATASA